jgi:hypothetical protein
MSSPLEEIDLAVLVRRAAERVPSTARVGALDGRTAFRDAVMDLLRCSALQAEDIVDTLVAREFLVFRDDLELWDVRPGAS